MWSQAAENADGHALLGRQDRYRAAIGRWRWRELHHFMVELIVRLVQDLNLSAVRY